MRTAIFCTKVNRFPNCITRPTQGYISHHISYFLLWTKKVPNKTQILWDHLTAASFPFSKAKERGREGRSTNLFNVWNEFYNPHIQLIIMKPSITYIISDSIKKKSQNQFGLKPRAWMNVKNKRKSYPNSTFANSAFAISVDWVSCLFTFVYSQLFIQILFHL